MIHVAVGVVIDGSKILIAKRRQQSDHGGLWEFPGGKVESGETVYDALCRELKEEVNITVLSAEPFISVKHQYQQYNVLLDVWRVNDFSGDAKGVEGQSVRWVDITELECFEMPEANHDIISALHATTS